MEGAKRQRRMMPLTQKLELLDMLACGNSIASVGRCYGINESTVRCIKKQEDRIRASVEACGKKSAKMSFVTRRDTALEKMEKALDLWIEDKIQKKMPLTGSVIREKALRLYRHLSHSEGAASNSTFNASKGWFNNFKKRFSLRNIKLDGESTLVDPESANEFPKQLLEVIEDKGYKPEQVFSANDTGLFWKRMPSRTFLSKEEKIAPGFKAARDRLTVLLCVNALGDCMVKPMLVYHSFNPRALKSKNKDSLPAFWRANKKGWLTDQLFMEWFNNCFINETEIYLKRKNLDFKVLLILKNMPGYPASVKCAHPNVEVIFMPAKVSPILQPLDQGIISIFKIYYTRHTFCYIHNAIQNDKSFNISKCWKSYNIADGIINIKESLDEISPSVINSCWSKVCRDIVNDSQEFPDIIEEIKRVVEIGRDFPGEGFDDLELDDIEELIQSHTEELTEEDLEQLIQFNENDEDGIVHPHLTIESLSEIIMLADTLAEKITEKDPFIERRVTSRKKLQDLITPYKELFKAMQKKANESATESRMESPELPPPSPETATNSLDWMILNWDLHPANPLFR